MASSFVTRWWAVTFRGSLSDDAAEALTARGLMYVSGHYRLSASGAPVDESNTVLAVARDGFRAIREVEAALEGHGLFTDFVADELKYLAYFGVPVEDAGALDLVRDEDPRIRSVSPWSPTHDDAEILFELRARSTDEALEQALESYADLRQRAGLDPAEPLYAMVSASGDEFAPDGSYTAFFRHVGRARDLVTDEQYDLAVIVAQTSCEVLVQSVVMRMLGDGEAEGESAGDRVLRNWWSNERQPCSLTNDRVRELWNAIAGEDIQKQEPWWKEYRDHCTRRHGIVHRGATASRADAEHSLKATESFRAYVLATFQRVRRDRL